MLDLLFTESNFALKWLPGVAEPPLKTSIRLVHPSPLEEGTLALGHRVCLSKWFLIYGTERGSQHKETNQIFPVF